MRNANPYPFRSKFTNEKAKNMDRETEWFLNEFNGMGFQTKEEKGYPHGAYQIRAVRIKRPIKIMSFIINARGDWLFYFWTTRLAQIGIIDNIREYCNGWEINGGHTHRLNTMDDRKNIIEFVRQHVTGHINNNF